ncbi:glutamate 5-kinase [Leptolinea tardivitalis]|uniref:Glutamate 5-kinase n=1 Tax=Leptolinea tardivitalis TaxID=229920 RepID=A0A0P6X0X2_9CHLR|nr:glutamate 5-kinase [Leptolinea tardivitalis]KPL72857.1 gamma-glutamyl kinase [Leptolinea tardivitalis]GAP20767.1 glutamate 5-kinase [Leptolinea tardivitalis]
MESHRVIIKVGTSTLTAGSHRLSIPHIFDITRQIMQLKETGAQVALVTSGAIAAGREAMSMAEAPRFTPGKQMLAAIGQPRLIAYYDQFFRMFGQVSAQVLLTREDLTDRNRYLNARGTFEGLLEGGVVPIINENDTVATEEIRFGDNDNLSALVANLVEADLLLLLTDQAGLFTGDPRKDENARLIEKVDQAEIPLEYWEAAGGSQSGLGTGGMVTKLRAADLARRAGVKVVIASGSEPDIILKAASGKQIGTQFPPLVSKLESRKRFLLAGKRGGGILSIDEGATLALRKGGSLLPVGIREVTGEFSRGATVRILDVSGSEVAVGMTSYDSSDLKKIIGCRSDEIESILGFTEGDEAVHHNNMLLLKPALKRQKGS